MAETKVGYVYVAINGSTPWLKIGVTSGSPHDRMKQLSAASGVPTPFVLAYSRKVRDPFSVETWLHDTLAAHRVNDAREFFDLPLHEAIELIDTFDEVGPNSAVYLKTPFADLFASFPDDDGGRALTPDEQMACRDLEDQLNPPYQDA